ncbi:hypothetical protein O3M35_012115 [Rhynocoris fuscipes]|uniref:Uncharacterized protein n=1 Tax=Rhynocoris fuscipes TaxID=488301 RepID=A0AAW1CTR4_9HEMI
MRCSKCQPLPSMNFGESVRSVICAVIDRLKTPLLIFLGVGSAAIALHYWLEVVEIQNTIKCLEDACKEELAASCSLRIELSKYGQQESGFTNYDYKNNNDLRGSINKTPFNIVNTLPLNLMPSRSNKLQSLQTLAEPDACHKKLCQEIKCLREKEKRSTTEAMNLARELDEIREKIQQTYVESNRYIRMAKLSSNTNYEC